MHLRRKREELTSYRFKVPRLNNSLHSFFYEVQRMYNPQTGHIPGYKFVIYTINKKNSLASIWNLRNLAWQILSVFFFSFYPFSGFLYDFCSLQAAFFISSTVCLNDLLLHLLPTVSSNVFAVSLIIPLSLRFLDFY